MKRIIALLVIALLGFYVAWPAYSGYRIATALTNQDEAALEGKVDFVAIRDSLRPAATAEISKQFDRQAGSLGAVGQALGGDVKQQVLGTLVEQVLTAVVTPKVVIRIASEGGDIAATVEKVMGEAAGQMGGVTGGNASASGAQSSGGLLGQVLGAAGGAGVTGADLGGLAGKVLGGMKKPSDATTAAAPTAAVTSATKRSFGLGNIKGLSMAGPFGFNVAVARDAAQPKADATIGMSFTGSDWKLTRVVPNL